MPDDELDDLLEVELEPVDDEELIDDELDDLLDEALLPAVEPFELEADEPVNDELPAPEDAAPPVEVPVLLEDVPPVGPPPEELPPANPVAPPVRVPLLELMVSPPGPGLSTLLPHPKKPPAIESVKPPDMTSSDLLRRTIVNLDEKR